MEYLEMKEKILNMLEELCEDSIVKEELNIDLFENDLLDSLSFAELLVDIETNFNIIIAPSEVSREDMNTPEKIVALIQARSK